jgi:hypothetical protein
MQIEDAQREVRTVYLGGAVGAVVSAVLWLVSSAFGTWGSKNQAILAMIIGGPMIFPATMLGLKLLGRRATLSHGNPMGQLATQVAFTIPLAYPVIGAAVLHNVNWFYPAFMVIVGAHYLPFVFLYGMKIYFALGGILVLAGWFVGTGAPKDFALGGWVTAVIFLLWAMPARLVAARQDRAASSS